MQKKSFLFIVLLFILTGVSQQVCAQGYNYPAMTGPFGIGIMLGEPTGVVAKLWLSNSLSADGAFAWSFLDGGFFYTHLDVQYSIFNIVDNQDYRFPFYIGAGARLLFNGIADQTSILGIIIPVGVTFIFRQLPIDAFIEVVPGFGLFPNNNFSFSGGVGARYYF